MRWNAFLVLSVSAVALSACAAKPSKPPAMSYDSGSFKPAVIQNDPEETPVEVIGEVSSQPPVAASSLPPKPDTRPPTVRIEAANRAALQEPTRSGYRDAVQLYQYNEGALYHLYAAPEQITDVALQPGEALSSVSSGDTVRWVVQDTTSGNGIDKRVHIMVKPFAPDLHTNLVITTDRRSYHLQLDSTNNTSMAVVSWNYPGVVAKTMQSKQEVEAPFSIDQAAPPESRKFRYAISGDNTPWKPVRVFDNTRKVYIEFPGRIDQGEAPPLFVVGPEGNAEIVNFRMKENYYIVDRLFAAAELRLGSNPQQVVRINRNDAIATAVSKEKKGG